MNLIESLKFYIDYIKYEKNLSLNSCQAYKNDIIQFLNFIVSKEKINYAKDKKNSFLELSNNKDFITEENLSSTKIFQKLKANDYINLENFRSFLKYINSFNYSNSTIIRKISSLCNYFKFLEINKILSYPLSQYIIPPKKVNYLYVFLSQNEIQNLINSIDTTKILGIRDRALIGFLYSTGARVGEVEFLKVSDLKLDKKEAIVFGKRRKYRKVFLNTDTIFWLKKYLEVRSSIFEKIKNKPTLNNNYLFISRFGLRLSQRSIRKLIKHYAQIAGLNKIISPHNIRHTFATHLLQEGAGIREIQMLLGHENISTTQIYTHLNIKKLKEEYEKFHPRAK